MVCLPFPKSTVADALISAQAVVLARENPQEPFAYIAVDVLKGDLDAPEIDLFVNSTIRRRLALEPDRAVVLVLEGAESTAGSRSRRTRLRGPETRSSPWRSVGYATPRYESFVREILARAARWHGKAISESRATYFMRYLADEERSIREAAYLEVGRASYNTIRKADRFVSADQVHSFLADPLYLEWRALYVLLLGVDATPSEKEAIRATMARLGEYDQPLNLSAWATAFIEIDREEAVDWLEEAFIGAPDRDPDTVLEILKALSVHGGRERSGLRARIAESYGELIEAHPSLAGWAARDLLAWRDWRFAGALEDLRRSAVTLDSATAYAIDFYIGRAPSMVSN